MRPKIAVAIAAHSAQEAVRLTRKASRMGGDLVEIRFDYLKMGESLEKIAKEVEMPLIATFRSENRGSAQRIEEEKRIETLIAAAKAGFSYVDVEVETRNLRSVLKQAARARRNNNCFLS